MNGRNEKLIDIIIKKADAQCHDSLALIGVYGSVITGDEYEKSDLDLMILRKNKMAEGQAETMWMSSIRP